MDSPLGEVTYVKSCGPAKGGQEGGCGTGSPSAAQLGGADSTGEQPPASSADLHGAAIVVLAHNRKEDLRQCLESLLSLPDVGMFRLHVSLDDADVAPAMRGLVEETARAKGVNIEVWLQKPLVPDVSKHNLEVRRWFNMNAGKIAHHYWAVFEMTFMERKYDQAIFVEEDLIFSPDFLALFRSTAWLLRKDPSLWCVSAWNDFGSAAAAVDTCRLQRSSYFPGLGFLLPRGAWLRLREVWPTAPTMGWDYWMRVAFRREGKECVIPEVSRSHHVSMGGSSVTKSKQLRLFRLMAFARIPTTCNSVESCHHFGDLSYLLDERYEQWMRSAIAQSPLITQRDFNGLKPGQLYILPFQREELTSLAERLGLVPKGTKNAIPADLRSEHYGIVSAVHVETRGRVLLVDRRSPRGYLPANQRRQQSEQGVPVAAARGESCSMACASRAMLCDAEQLHFLNSCDALEKHFACEGGCAHQVGKELPVYVPDEMQPTYRQCLVTFISHLTCEAQHPSTARLCACVPSAAQLRLRGG